MPDSNDPILDLIAKLDRLDASINQRMAWIGMAVSVLREIEARDDRPHYLPLVRALLARTELDLSDPRSPQKETTNAPV